MSHSSVGSRHASAAWLAAALVHGACSTHQAPAARPAVTAAATEPTLSIAELDDLLNMPAGARVAGPITIDTYRETIRDGLARPEFYDAFVPSMFTFLDVHQTARPLLMNEVLAKGVSKDGRIYFYLQRIGDCLGKDVVAVKPWWALDTDVAVCASAIRADVVRVSDGTYCDAGAFPVPECGCGPNLVQCAPSPAWRVAGALQARLELHRTVRHVVVNKLPYSSVLTMQDSVRSTFGDFWYARSAFFQGAPLALPRLADEKLEPLPAVLTDFELRPRRPEHRGGVLTTPVFLFADGSRRVAVQNLWSDVLCVDWSTTSIDPHLLVQLATETNDIRVELNQKLIDTPGCRECHTRLEYPVFALEEFTNFFKGSRYVPRPTPATAKLYVMGASDLRAEFAATPLGLGAQIAAQPEFKSCAVSKVLAYAYQGYPVPDGVRGRLLAQFTHGEDLGKLIEDALLARIFGEAAVAAAP